MVVLLNRPIHARLQCFIDPKGDVNTNGFIASQLSQGVSTDECFDFACHDILDNVCHRNVWCCPSWLADELLANRNSLKLNFDLYVREAGSSVPPHLALCLENGQSPEEGLRAILDSLALQVSCDFNVSGLPLSAGDFTFLLPTSRPPLAPPSSSMRSNPPRVPSHPRRDRRKW